MKKLSLKTLVLFLSATMILISCKKDNPAPVYELENPLNGFLTAEGLVLDYTIINDAFYEQGTTFKPLVNGKIESIVVKLPDNITDLRVTIWDATTKTVLLTETIPAVVADTELVHDITPLALQKDKTYAITYNGDDWYGYVKTNGSLINFPVNVNNISILNYAYILGTGQVFPTTDAGDFYEGLVSFNFRQTN